MTELINLLIILILIPIVLLPIGWRVIQGNKKVNKAVESDREHFSIPTIEQFIKEEIKKYTTMNLYNLGLAGEVLRRQTRQLKELKDALKRCNTGDIGSKIYVREFIYNKLNKVYGFTEDNINWAIPFNSPAQLSAREVFDILLFVYIKEHGNQALGAMIDEFDLASPKDDGGYRIYEEELRRIYKLKVKNLSLEDKLRIVVQRIYSQYKGFGVIDDIRDMNIDGVSGGVSGLPKRMENLDDEEIFLDYIKTAATGLNSVWMMYEGKTIHLSFLAFEHEGELKRVVSLVYKYKYPGQLSESKPYMINEMYDGSRVTVVRPNFAESWAFFIRKKYDLKKLEVEQLIQHPNAELPISVMKFLMKGNRVTAVTGSPGSGKTTLLMGLVGYIHKSLNLRVLETAFELNLRSIFPNNILSLQETDIVSGQEGLDLSKKMDGDVTILGEVATDPVAAWMIQLAQVASLFTIFTHHAKTFDDLIISLRNSLLRANSFSNEAIAEQQVVSVLEFDIHLRQDYDGTRYIERITECIPIRVDSENTVGNLQLPATRREMFEQFMQSATLYFQQKTQKRQFKGSNIVEFKDGRYVAGEPISAERIQEIESHLSDTEKIEFRSLVNSVWGNVA